MIEQEQQDMLKSLGYVPVSVIRLRQAQCDGSELTTQYSYKNFHNTPV